MAVNELEKALLQEVTGGVEPRLCIRTRTRVDTGLWLRRSPLWLCVTDSRLILFAVAKRRYVQSVDLMECLTSRYCQATGEFIIAPVEGLEFGQVAISPAEAVTVFKMIVKGCEFDVQ